METREQGEACSGGHRPGALPVLDEGRLAMDLVRLAAEVLERGSQLEVLNARWVDRYVRSARPPAERTVSTET